jgi:hypothetical protein
MSSSSEAFAQLNEWKSRSAKLFMHWSFSTAHGWCVGLLKHVSSSELHFGIDTIDGKDFLFVINVHATYNPRFSFVDNREAWQFFAPRRERSEFGKGLRIDLQVDASGESQGKIILAEVFPKEAIDVDRSRREL